MGQSEIVPGKSGLNKKRQRYNSFYFLKFNMIIRHQCYIYFYARNIAQEVVWSIKHKLMQLVIHLVQRTFHINIFGKRSTFSNVLYLDIE